MNIEFAYIAYKYTDFDIHKNDKNPNVKVSDCIRIFLQEVTLKLGWKNLSLLKNVKKLCCGHIDVIDDLHGEEIVGTFYEKSISNRM